MKDELMLLIDGREHKGWENAKITRSIERGVHSFSLALSDRWGAAEETNPRTVTAGMSVDVYINDELLTRGYIDQIAPSYTDTSHIINVQGRSKIGDLVDCSTKGKQFKGQSLVQICQTLCKPFSIAVSVDDAVQNLANKRFVGRNHKLDLGQPIWEFLEEIARLRGVLLVSDAQGDLRIIRAGSAVADVALVLGKNIKKGDGQYSTHGVFSEYHVSGQQPSEPKRTFVLKNSTTTVAQAAQVTSNSIDRYRPFYTSSDNPLSIAECQARADWQKNVNEGRAETTTYTVSGWRQNEDGRLWQPNELVDIVDPWIGLDDRRLIVETSITLGEGGSNTSLKIMPKEAFAMKPIVRKVSKKKARGFILPPKGTQ